MVNKRKDLKRDKTLENINLIVGPMGLSLQVHHFI